MKIKSTLLDPNSSIIKIEIGNNYDPKSHLTEENITLKNENLEDIKSRHLITEGMVLLDTQMYFSNAKTIVFEIDEESVIMNFICCSNIETHVEQLETEKFHMENTHNIFYSTNYKATFKIPAFEHVNYLSIILSKDTYFNIINEEWQLHKKFSTNISIKKSSYLTSKYLPFTPAIQWIIHEIKNCNRKGVLKKIYIEAKIKELLIHQIETVINLPNPIEHIDEDDYNKLQQAKDLLEKDCAHAPTLSELSRLISLNEFKLKKGFKATFGTTVKSYVIKLRMERAKELFQNKAATVSEVAYKCGYKDVSHFSAAFKTFYGFTPQKFKTTWDFIQFWILGTLFLA